MSVVIETTLGDLTVDLFTEDRPQTCKNFLKLCKLKYYNFSLFHTVQANFIAQTGDPTGTGTGGESAYGIVYGPESKYYEAESMPKIKHTKPGLLSMVNCGNNMLGSQFFVTLGSELQSLDEHCVFGEVTEGQEVLLKLNEAVCDFQNRPYRDIRITHTVILEDPFEDISGMLIPPSSPDISQMPASNGRLGADEDVGNELTGAELEEANAEQEARARATILEIVGDIPHAEIAPPENVLFVCQLNAVTTDDDLELIFSRFGKINSCEVIKDHITGESLQYAFIEFNDKKSCEQAYTKMKNVLIDDRRIHVDFSQSVSKIRWKGKGRGVELLEKSSSLQHDDTQPKPLMDLRYSSETMMSRGRDQLNYYRGDGRDRRGRDDRRRDEGRGRQRDDDRRDDRRRDDDRRRRGDNRHDSRRPTESSSSRRHRDYADQRRIEDHSSDRLHRRHDEMSLQDSMNHRSGRHDERMREPSGLKHIKPLMEKNIIRPTQDNGDLNKIMPYKIADESPTKNKDSPQQDKIIRVPEEDVNDRELSKNESVSKSIAHSNVGSVNNSADRKKKKITKKKIKKKRRSSSTSSVSSDSSLSSSSCSSSSSSSTSSLSSREKRLKKKGKSKRHRHSGVLTKKYYNRKGKLIKVVKKMRKHSSSSSDSSSDSSDVDRKRSKKKHKRRKKKKLDKKSSHKKGTRISSEGEEVEESEGTMSDDSKTSDKFLKKRKLDDRSGLKNNKKEGDRMSETSHIEDDAVLIEKKKFKSSTTSLKKS